MFMCRKRDRARIALKVGLALLTLVLPGVGARADDSAPPAPPPDEGMVKNLARKVETMSASKVPGVRTLAKKIGIVADPGDAPDFVVNARPAGEEDYVPVGRKEFERPIKPKTPKELKAVEADFDAVKVRHDALRSTFAPAVKAVAAAEAAKAAKAAKPKKTPAAPASPQ